MKKMWGKLGWWLYVAGAVALYVLIELGRAFQ